MSPTAEAPSKVLGFVEDDEVIRENYSDYLREFGFEVRAFADRHSALIAFREELPDVAVLDVALGAERDAGFQLCMDLRRISDTLPIIFLTSHDGEVDKISGLRLGADDYLSKESSIDLLVVRLETLLRRYESVRGTGAPQPHDSDALVRGQLRVDRGRSEVTWNGRPVDLSLTQLWMVEALAESPSRALSHNELMRAAKIVVEPNTIAAHVKTIRQAFRAVDPDFAAIRTERGLGYRWREA
jgi:two-component system OmpR family response regulator